MSSTYNQQPKRKQRGQAGKSKNSATVAAGSAAVVVAGSDGKVVTQSEIAARVFGDGVGANCWDVVGDLSGASGLPCERGCVQRLLLSGPDKVNKTYFTHQKSNLCLSCVPVGDTVVCTVTGLASELPGMFERLTPREREILVLVADGHDTDEIAESLAVQPSTIRTHVENMRNRLGVRTRAALVARAFRLGVIT